MYTLILKEVDKGAFSEMSEENVTSKCQKKCKSCLHRYPHYVNFHFRVKHKKGRFTSIFISDYMDSKIAGVSRVKNRTHFVFEQQSAEFYYLGLKN